VGVEVGVEIFLDQSIAFLGQSIGINEKNTFQLLLGQSIGIVIWVNR